MSLRCPGKVHTCEKLGFRSSATKKKKKRVGFKKKKIEKVAIIIYIYTLSQFYSFLPFKSLMAFGKKLFLILLVRAFFDLYPFTLCDLEGENILPWG